MKKKVIILLVLILGLAVLGIKLFFRQTKKPLSNPQANVTQVKEIKISETDIEYTDPAGFSFSYPDNLSIVKAEIEDANTYADLQLFSKDVSGSVKIVISDSKFKSLDDWLKANQISLTPKEVKLGSLKAVEVKTNDRLLLGALDQGVLFTIELPLIEESFWMKVYNKIVSEFKFISPDTNASQGGADASLSDVTFESEEVVE